MGVLLPVILSNSNGNLIPCATKYIGNKLTKHMGNSLSMVIAKQGQGRAMRMQQTERDGAKGDQP
ncbi:MAG: hypothetical protein ABIH46_13140, partial [Chloroflexota bacterium]